MPSDIVIVAAICAIAVVEVSALALGYDGAILAGVIAALSALGGYRYGTRRARPSPVRITLPR